MSTLLQQFSDHLADLVATTAASTVRVDGRRRMPATGIVWSEDGVIVTAHHVITRDENLRVGLPDGTTVAATLAGRDPSSDIAVLRADAQGLQVPKWADADSLQVGQMALALGRPHQAVRATLGVISALGGEWRTPAGGAIDRYVQTDVVMYPGFSGGPLVGAAETVLGLNTSALLHDASLAIPTPTLRRVVETLLAHGRVRRGYLGIGSQPVRLPDSLAAQVNQETALLLTSVEPDSPAAQAGLMMGDTIIALNGETVRHMDDLRALLGGDLVGKTVPVRLIHGGEVRELIVTIGEWK